MSDTLKVGSSGSLLWKPRIPFRLFPVHELHSIVTHTFVLWPPAIWYGGGGFNRIQEGLVTVVTSKLPWPSLLIDRACPRHGPTPSDWSAANTSGLGPMFCDTGNVPFCCGEPVARRYWRISAGLNLRPDWAK